MVKTGEINGHTAFWLENEHLKVCVFPTKGADIYDIVYAPDEIDFLMKTPWGLKPPDERPPADFLENYEGGWQELFPNPGDAADYDGVEIPFHGEAALLAWDYEITGENEARLWVDCQRTPFRLERRMRLHANEPVLEIQGSVSNLSNKTQEFLWGQHVVLGGRFLEGGCRMETPAKTILTPDVLYEPETAKLAPGQREPWPHALTRNPGERYDLREIPGPESRWHDDIYLLGLSRGEVIVTNPKLRLGFHLKWDAQLFPCLVNWRPLGGADMPPLTGIYGLGIEPWTSHYSLTEARSRGEARRLGAGEILQTTLFVSILTGND